MVARSIDWCANDRSIVRAEQSMDSANRSTAHNIATGGTRYFFQIDIFTTIRMVLKRVKNVHSNGKRILIIISSFFIRSIRQCMEFNDRAKKNCAGVAGYPVPPKNCPAGQRSLGYVVPPRTIIPRSALGFAVPLRFCKQSLTHSIGY